MIRRHFLRLSAFAAVGVAAIRHIGWAASALQPTGTTVAPPSRQPWLIGSARTGCARSLECAEILNSWRHHARGEFPL